MKRTFIIVLLVLFSTVGQAQEGEILYTNFEPDNCIDHPYIQEPFESIKIDFNQDGIIDVTIYNFIESTQYAHIAVFINDAWECRRLNDDYPNDTIIPSNEFDWAQGILGDAFFPSHGVHHADRTYGFRILNDGNYYYAWMHFYADRVSLSQTSVCVDQYAYCTIPDYPLHWGQTSLNWAVEENSEISAGIHPNPTNDYITIDLPNDEDCQSIEIFSIDGRLVETFQETSHPTTINISALHTGMYIMKIRMADGREFSEKIVKE